MATSRASRQRESPVSFFSFQDIVCSITGVMILVSLTLTLEVILRPQKPESAPVLDELRTALRDARRERDELRRIVAENQALLDRLSRGEVITQGQLDALAQSVARLEQEVERTVDRIAERRTERGRAVVLIASGEKELGDLKTEIARLNEFIEKNRTVTPVTWVVGDTGGLTPLLVECNADSVVVAGISRTGVAEPLRQFTDDDPVMSFIQWSTTCDRTKEYFVLLLRPQAVEKFGLLLGGLQVNNGFKLGWDVWPDDRRLIVQP